MPRFKNALTLKQTCTNVIARHFERLWGQHFDRQLGDLPRLLYVIGPFDDLPSVLCEDILQQLVDQRFLRKSHFQLLLLPHIRRIRFAATCSNSVLTHGLDLLTLRCKKLVSLNLTNCKSLPPKSIAECVSALPLLNTLILKQTKTNDEVMRIIALSLPQLTHLDLYACPVTDRGALLFCGDQGDFDPVCTTLTLLDINATKIELLGCSTIVKHYPRLRYLYYPDTVEAVARLHKGGTQTTAQTNSKGRRGHNNVGTSLDGSEIDRSISNHYKLEVLHATALRCSRISSDSVYLACLHCANVREVYWFQDATDEGLRLLSALQHLCVLEVTSDKPHDVTFHDGVLPLLRERGKEMVALALHDIQGTDLGLVGHLCPHLHRLKVICLFQETDFAYSYLTTQQQAASFKELHQLTMVFESVDFQFNLLDMLDRAAALQELCLISVPGVTDEVLVAALSVHKFQNMKQVQVESCGITIHFINQLVDCCDLLSHMSMRHCQLITYQDYQELQKFIRNNRLDLTVDYE